MESVCLRIKSTLFSRWLALPPAVPEMDIKTTSTAVTTTFVYAQPSPFNQWDVFELQVRVCRRAQPQENSPSSITFQPFSAKRLTLTAGDQCRPCACFYAYCDQVCCVRTLSTRRYSALVLIVSAGEFLQVFPAEPKLLAILGEHADWTTFYKGRDRQYVLDKLPRECSAAAPPPVCAAPGRRHTTCLEKFPLHASSTLLRGAPRHLSSQPAFACNARQSKLRTPVTDTPLALHSNGGS